MTDTNLSAQYRQEIKNYLENENRTFADGFALLQKFSNKLALLAQIQRKATSIMHKKIDYELKQIAERPTIKLSPYVNKTSIAPAVAQSTKVPHINSSNEEQKTFDAIAPEVKEQAEIKLKDRLTVSTSKLNIKIEEMPIAIKELFNKACRFHHLKVHYFTLMKTIPAGDEHNAKRSEALKLAKEYEKLNKEAWAKIDDWADAGKPALDNEKTADTEQTSADAARAIGTAKSYISRYTGKLDMLQGKKYEDRKSKLQQEVKVLLDNGVDIPAKNVETLKKHAILE